MSSLRVVFAGTPAFGLACLASIYQSQHQLVAIYTQPDRPAGRGQRLQASPIKTWALEQHLPVYQPVNFKSSEDVRILEQLQPDIMVVIAYGLILPKTVLTIPKYGCINVHASLLPRWRGASPIQQTILHGDAATGITIMQMDAGMDTGNIIQQASCQVDKTETAGSLQEKLANLAIDPLMATLAHIATGPITNIPQDQLHATYAPKIKKSDAIINWQQPAVEIERQIRAFNPWPIAETTAHALTMRIQQAKTLATTSTASPGTILAITKTGIQVACKDQNLLIERIQFAGKKPMLVADWLNAQKLELRVGQQFS